MASSFAPSSISEIRVSELLSPAVRVDWHEAVAVVRQIATQTISASNHQGSSVSGGLIAGDGNGDGARLQGSPPAKDLATGEYVNTTHGIPDPTGILLLTSGAIRIDAAAASAGGAIVPRLATLLSTLLTPSAPLDLQQLVTHSTAIGDASPQEFLSALSYFARPDDSGEIRALVTRVLELRLADERAHALQSLTERTRHADAHTPMTGQATRKPMVWLRLVLVVTSLFALAGLSIVAWGLMQRASVSTRGSASAAVTPPNAARRVQQSLTLATALVTDVLRGAPETPSGRGADMRLPAPGRRRAGRREMPTVSVSPSLAERASRDAARPADVTGTSGAPQHGEPHADGAVDAQPAVTERVYSAAHPEVIAPALVRAQMPQALLGGLPVERPGVLELVVDPRGQVLSAKLVPASGRYQDRMMVSAAKTWRFRPALSNGRPVPYRLQMPITW